MPALTELSLLETRVLGVLVEKQRTVPDTYPLSLNALTAGCNQKTSRDPVLDASEADVAEAIVNLKRQSLVMESSGGRVTRYAHNFERGIGVPTQAAALLTILMLRGPQTAGELRINCERLHKFADIGTVEAFLQELAERAEGPLVIELPRQPGARENRWAHLLSGQPSAEQLAAPTASSNTASSNGLEARVSRLEDEVAQLRTTLAQLQAALGN